MWSYKLSGYFPIKSLVDRHIIQAPVLRSVHCVAENMRAESTQSPEYLQKNAKDNGERKIPTQSEIAKGRTYFVGSSNAELSRDILKKLICPTDNKWKTRTNTSEIRQFTSNLNHAMSAFTFSNKPGILGISLITKQCPESQATMAMSTNNVMK
ncbi:hypothetical protein DINM_006640 [Dirofilaria immitis]|nr:hypothetical protein [Dirofilaria immitis]